MPVSVPDCMNTMIGPVSVGQGTRVVLLCGVVVGVVRAVIGDSEFDHTAGCGWHKKGADLLLEMGGALRS